MPFIIADRVRETSSTVGTGSIALGGAVLGFQTFDAVLDTGDTTFYVFADQGGANWEVGIGTFTAPSTLARTTILSSSNGGSIVNFGVGTKDVFISLPASKTNVEDQPNLIEVNSSSAALRITQTGSGNALLVEDSANPDSSPFVVDASGNVGVGTTTPTAPLDVNGNVAITGTARRITGDFSNATFTSRLIFQSSSGTFSDVGVMGPNASQSASWAAYFGNDPTNTSRTRMLATSVDARFESSATGTGTALPMTFYTGGSERMRLDTSGNLGLGTSSPIGRLSVNLGDASGNVFAWDSTYATFGAAGSTTGKAVGIGFNATSNYGEIRSVEPGVAWRDLYIRGNNLNFYSSIAGVSTLGMVLNTSGNVGIGTATPGAPLAFAATVGTAGDANKIRLFDDNAGNVYGFGISSNQLNVRAGSSGSIALFTNGANERMRIDASGNVGIGTSSPGNKLDVLGAGIRVRNGSVATEYYDIGRDGSDGFLSLNGAQTSFSGYKWAVNNGSEVMRITNAGNVGIGMTDPGGRNSRLAVNGNISLFSTGQNFYPYYFSATNHAYISSSPGGDMTFGTGTGGVAERMSITAGGNVGIGTSSPQTKLHLLTPSATSVALRAGNSVSFAEFQVDASGNSQLIAPGGVQIFNTNGAERMRIDASGNVGIGTSSGGPRLHVLSADGVTTARISGASFAIRVQSIAGVGAWIDATNSTEATYQPLLIGGSQVQFTTSGTERARITAGGDFLFNSGYGSVAVAYACRAWVNFNGTGTVAIRLSRNVSSITDLGGSGVYRVNFTTAMPDANYAAQVTGSTISGNGAQVGRAVNYAAASVDCDFGVPNVTSVDQTTVSVSIFR